jgi:hypothetical protein
MIGKGERSAELLTKARILWKADVSEAGDGLSDSQIADVPRSCSTSAISSRVKVH